MKEEAKEKLVGSVVFLTFLLGVGFAYGGHNLDDSDGYLVSATFGRVDGLGTGADVYMGGISIGSVEEMSLDKNYRAVLTLRLSDAVKIPTDSSAAIHTDGLFGSKYVILEPGGEETYIPAGGAFTVTQDSLVVSDLLELIISQGKQVRDERNAADDTKDGGGADGVVVNDVKDKSDSKK